MKIIVGLGNPGSEYNNTRHNVGFYYLDSYVKEKGVTINKEKFNGLYTFININNEKVLFLKPLSYMNLSGVVIQKFMHYYKIEIEDLLVIHDDLDMNIGRIKLRQHGSSGGHNGIGNIIDYLNSGEFKRLKIGISKNNNLDTKDYVLGKFTDDEKELLNKNKDMIFKILDDYFKLPFGDLMSIYNRREPDVTE